MKDRVKLLQVFTVLNTGGAETNIMNYLRKMDREKFQIDFLVHRDSGFYEEEIKMLGGEIFRVPPVHPLKLNAYKKEVIKFFQEHSGYQIIHGQLSELGVFIYEEAKRKAIPVIIAHAHNVPVGFDRKTLFRYRWKKRMRKSINTYFTCGKEAAEWLFGKHKAKEAFLMTNAIEVQDFSWNPELSHNLRKNLQIDKQLNFIHVGRFNDQKNHLFLLEVFGEIVKKNSTAHLFLIGDGELREKIENKIEQLDLTDNVHLLGVRSDVNELLQAMDYFIFPSKYEGLGIAFIEAQTSGLKCFISDGIPDEAVLVPENVEVISLKKSAAEWAEIILTNLEYERRDVSAIIREKGYDINDNVKKLEEKYLELLRNAEELQP